MKIIVTGSLGNISKPLTEELLQNGHAVTVISSKPEKQKDIVALGATAAIGRLEDAHFLTATFAGADAVYCMEPRGGAIGQNLDVIAYTEKLCSNYVEAIKQAGVKRVVHLSSVGAHTDKGNGVLAFHYKAEKTLDKLPPEVGITFLRPVGFYPNLLDFVNMIKTQGAIASNYGGTDRIILVSPLDIAAAAAEEITTPLVGRKIRYVASEDLTCNEVAGILGAAIGKPDLKWILIPDERVLNGLIASGMNPRFAAGLVEMNASRHSGVLYEDYDRNRPTLGSVKLKEYAKEFAAVFNQK